MRQMAEPIFLTEKTIRNIQVSLLLSFSKSTTKCSTLINGTACPSRWSTCQFLSGFSLIPLHIPSPFPFSTHFWEMSPLFRAQNYKIRTHCYLPETIFSISSSYTAAQTATSMMRSWHQVGGNSRWMTWDWVTEVRIKSSSSLEPIILVTTFRYI